jgi:hypothetical protein
VLYNNISRDRFFACLALFDGPNDSFSNVRFPTYPRFTQLLRIFIDVFFLAVGNTCAEEFLNIPGEVLPMIFPEILIAVISCTVEK